MGRLWGRTGNLIAFYILNWVGSSGFLPLEKRQKCWESPTPEAQIYRVRLSLKLEQEHWKTSSPTTGLTPRNKQPYLLLEKWWEYGETFPLHPRTDPVVLILRAYCKLRVGHKHLQQLFDTSIKMSIFGIVTDFKKFVQIVQRFSVDIPSNSPIISIIHYYDTFLQPIKQYFYIFIN